MKKKKKQRDVEQGYVNAERVAQHLSIKKRTIYEYAATGKIPHYRAGRLIRFKLSEIEEWMESNKVNVVDIPYDKL